MSEAAFIRRNGRWRLTLAEWVAAILAVIAFGAVAVPVGRGMHGSAMSAKTVDHLRCLQAANIDFSRDNNGFFVGNAPFAGGDMWSQPWFSYPPLLDMLGAGGEARADPWGRDYPEILKCGPDVAVDLPPRDDRNFTIAMNMTGWTHRQDGTPVSERHAWFGCWSAGKILQSRIKNPSHLIMFYEAGTFSGYMYDRLQWKGDVGPHPRGMAFRNKGGRCNVVFADGHVGSLERADVAKDDEATRRHFWWDADMAGPVIDELQE